MRNKKGFSPILIIFVLVVVLLGLSIFLKTKIPNINVATQPQIEKNNQTQNSDLLMQTITQQTKEEEGSFDPTESPKLLGVVTGPNYSVVTYSLASTTVVTDTAGDDDCDNNCPTKSLAQYIKDNGGRAGMNGTYFCPPDYNWCSSKVNSYDFPVWNNRKKKWMQANKLFWNGRGMMVFRSGSAQFFPNSASIGAPSDITGGIINYPSLLAGGKLILDEGSLADNLKNTKGTRSGIGFGKGKLFLVVARRANMKDLAGIFISLGATDALNLDGGGSAALYDTGRYKAGPGRSLPNAIVVK